MTHNIYIYIAIMAGVSFLIRTLPLTPHPQADYQTAFCARFCFMCPMSRLR